MGTIILKKGTVTGGGDSVNKGDREPSEGGFVVPADGKLVIDFGGAAIPLQPAACTLSCKKLRGLLSSRM